MTTDIKDIVKNPPAPSSDVSDVDVMQDPDYLRKSSSIITEALQKGFDILQLENGDIVTTGTKTVIYQYRWDNEQKKMVKMTAKERRDAETRSKNNSSSAS